MSGITGEELAEARLRAGLTQAELGARVGVSRQTVSHWEWREWVPFAQSTPQRLLRALAAVGAWPICETASTARAREGVLQDLLAASLEPEADPRDEERARWRAWAAARAAHLWVPCEARTRKGRPCRMASEPGRRRCRFHGGLSTGPRTAEGRARVAEAQRARWARWRAEREAAGPEEQERRAGRSPDPAAEARPPGATDGAALADRLGRATAEGHSTAGPASVAARRETREATLTEMREAVERTRAFLLAHGALRFEALGGDGVAGAGGDGRAVLDRAGWRDGSLFYLAADTWRDLHRGADPTRAARRLRDAGFLIPGEAGRLMTRPPRGGKSGPRAYAVGGGILEASGE